MTNLQIEMALIDVEVEICTLTEAMSQCWQTCRAETCESCDLFQAMVEATNEKMDLRLNQMVNDALCIDQKERKIMENNYTFEEFFKGFDFENVGCYVTGMEF